MRMTVPAAAKWEAKAIATISLNEKVCVTEVLQDELQNLLAVGLESSLVIIELSIAETDSLVDYSFIKKVCVSVISAIVGDVERVSRPGP